MTADVLLFDVNETLLDVRALGSAFDATFGDRALLPEWFGLLLRYSLEVSVTGDYSSFDALAVSALMTSSTRAGKSLSTEEAAGMVDAMSQLPAHPDVADGLAALKDYGFRLATLTNSRLDVAHAQLSSAGLDSYFDTVMSVETVQRFKPHPATYQYAAEQLDVPMGAITMVAAHDWDVNGAMLAGANAAFIERPGAAKASHDRIPELVAPDIVGLAALLTQGTE